MTVPVRLSQRVMKASACPVANSELPKLQLIAWIGDRGPGPGFVGGGVARSGAGIPTQAREEGGPTDREKKESCPHTAVRR